MDKITHKFKSRLAESVRSKVQIRLLTDRSNKRSPQLAAMAIEDVVFFLSPELYADSNTLNKMWRHNCPTRLHPSAICNDKLVEAAFKLFDGLSIGEIIRSQNPIIRGLGMLDSRTKTTALMRMNMRKESEFVRELFRFRCRSENLDVIESNGVPSALRKAKYERDAAIQSGLPILNQKYKTALDGVISSNAPTDDSKSSYTDFIQHVSRRSKLRNDSHIDALIQCFKQRKNWLRPISDWTPKSANRHKQFHSLLQHLFAKYETPSFMDNAWFSHEPVHHSWFIQLANGASLRAASDMPFKLTKKTIHILQSAPDYTPVSRAFRYAQAVELGADHRMAHFLASSRLSNWNRDEEFVLSVLRFFARNRQMSIANVRRALNYIWEQKYGETYAFVARGETIAKGPAQPNFTMQGRTAISLMRQIELDEQRSSLLERTAHFTWKRSDIPKFSHTEYSQDGLVERIWTITELLTGAELVAEGETMHHCVGKYYARHCARWNSGIFSLKLTTKTKIENVLTIEIDKDCKTICTVRGKCNRTATRQENQIIRRWSNLNNLEFFEIEF